MVFINRHSLTPWLDLSLAWLTYSYLPVKWSDTWSLYVLHDMLLIEWMSTHPSADGTNPRYWHHSSHYIYCDTTLVLLHSRVPSLKLAAVAWGNSPSKSLSSLILACFIVPCVEMSPGTRLRCNLVVSFIQQSPREVQVSKLLLHWEHVLTWVIPYYLRLAFCHTSPCVWRCYIRAYKW